MITGRTLWKKTYWWNASFFCFLFCFASQELRRKCGSEMCLPYILFFLTNKDANENPCSSISKFSFNAGFKHILYMYGKSHVHLLVFSCVHRRIKNVWMSVRQKRPGRWFFVTCQCFLGTLSEGGWMCFDVIPGLAWLPANGQDWTAAFQLSGPFNLRQHGGWWVRARPDWNHQLLPPRLKRRWWTVVSRWDLPKHNASVTDDTAVFCWAKAAVACN